MKEKIKFLLSQPLSWIALLIILILIFALSKIQKGEELPEQSKEEVLNIVTLPRNEVAPLTPKEENRIINLMTPAPIKEETKTPPTGDKEKEDIFKAMSL